VNLTRVDRARVFSRLPGHASGVLSLRFLCPSRLDPSVAAPPDRHLLTENRVLRAQLGARPATAGRAPSAASTSAAAGSNRPIASNPKPAYTHWASGNDGSRRRACSPSYLAAFWGVSAGLTYVIAKGPIAVTETMTAPLVAAK